MRRWLLGRLDLHLHVCHTVIQRVHLFAGSLIGTVADPALPVGCSSAVFVLFLDATVIIPVIIIFSG